MALINVAGILTGRGFRVLVVDLDLEAPGLSYLVREQAGADGSVAQPGFVDLLSDAIERGPEGDLFALQPNVVVERYSREYRLPNEAKRHPEGALRIMPAGRFAADYQHSLNELDLPGLYRDGRGRPLIEAFKKVIRDSDTFEFVLIDSRTGFSDESGICTRDLGDHLVIVTGLNNQNIVGTAEFLRALRQVTQGNKSIQFVLSPVPTGEDELVDQRERAAKKAFKDAWGKKVDLALQIPYHPRLALTEEPHIFRRSRGYLYEAYIEIAVRLLEKLRLTPEAIVNLVNKDIKAEQFDGALAKLKLVVKLFDGARSLEGVSIDHRKTSLRSSTINKILEFLAKELPSDSWSIDEWADRLTDAENPTANAFYVRLLEKYPNNENYGKYAIFLTDVISEYVAAEFYYKKALALDPNDANDLGNYAKLLFLSGKLEEAKHVLFRAFAGQGQTSNLLSELFFYEFAHLWTERPNALASLKGLLVSGARSEGWKLAANVERALEQGHPAIELLAVLANVIADEAPIESLDTFPLWTETVALPVEILKE